MGTGDIGHVYPMSCSNMFEHVMFEHVVLEHVMFEHAMACSKAGRQTEKSQNPNTKSPTKS